MVPSALTAEELTALVRRVFQPRAADRALALIVDLPDRVVADNERWRTRRELAAALDRAATTRGRFVLLDVVIERGRISGTLSRFVDGLQRRRAESG